MLNKTIFAAGALLSIAAAVPLQHQNKRDYIYETKTISEVTTVDVTTTVWLEPGETPPAHYGHYSHSKVTSHIQQTVTVPAASPASAAPSYPAEQPSYEAPSVPSPSAPAAPTTSAWVSAPAPTSAAPAPAPTSAAPAPAPKPSQSPPSSGGAPSSGQFTGEATYYTPGLGSCGQTNSESDSIVALAAGMMTEALGGGGNPNLNPLCGKSITISYNGVTAQATIVDTCPGCSGAGLDMTPTLFSKFASLDEGRLFGVSWSYN